MSSENLIIGRLDDNDDVQRHPLGSIYEEPADYIDYSAGVDNVVNYGRRKWIYVQIASGSVLTVGLAVARGLGAAGYTGCVVAPLSCPRHRVVGFAQGSIGDASAVRYAWLLREGNGSAVADASAGGVVVDQAIAVGNAVAGRCDSSATSTAADIGVALASQATAGSTFLAHVSCVG